MVLGRLGVPDSDLKDTGASGYCGFLGLHGDPLLRGFNVAWLLSTSWCLKAGKRGWRLSECEDRGGIPTGGHPAWSIYSV